MTLQPLHTYYWSQENFLRNMGDLLIVPLLEALGYRVVQNLRSSDDVVNPGRCFVGIGSLFVPWMLDLGVDLDFWGVGWKGKPIDRYLAALPQQVRIHAVRGPHTAARLRLAADTPLGDSALLYPHLLPRAVSSHGRTVLIPHLEYAHAVHATAQAARSQCDEILSPWVLHPQALMNMRGGRWRQVMRTVAQSTHRGVRIRSLRWTVDRIAGADFVLTGSLHGAILAQAYGVPWAAYDPGYIDFIAKWEDWAAYLGVELEFVRTAGEGRAWWRRCGRHGRIRSLQPLIHAFPYPIDLPLTRERIARIP